VIAGVGIGATYDDNIKRGFLTDYSLLSFPPCMILSQKLGVGGGRYINTTKYEGCQLSFSPGIYNLKKEDFSVVVAHFYILITGTFGM
jgi:hypothetical protein